jgi:glyoxylate reductase
VVAVRCAAVRVVSSFPLAPPDAARLGDVEVCVVDFGRADADALAAALAPASGLLVTSSVLVDEDVIVRSPALRVVSTVSAGFDHIDLAACRRRGIVVTTAPVLTDAVADLTMTLIVMTLRRLGEAVVDMQRGVWSNALLGTDVRGKTLLIVGFGRIGREVARRALAAKMQVLAFDVRSSLEPMDGVTIVESLSEGLRVADVVTLHVDLNPTTHHLVDARALAQMQPTAVLINASRGGVVDQVALCDALIAGRLAGAGLDVLESEPPDWSDPLLSMRNVVVLPHIGSATVETRRAMLECALDNLASCLRGEPCGWVLNLDR